MPKPPVKKQKVYLDHASTTYTDPRVLKTMLPYFTEKYGNPSSRHKKGIEAKIAVDSAREEVAEILHCKASEIIFCGSATEANNLAIFGIAKAHQNKGRHLITSSIEHSSVRAPFEKLEREGFKVTYLEVDKDGLVDPQTLEKAITKHTTFVSIIYANNEIGTIEEVAELGRICKKNDTAPNIVFHTDACQAANSESLNVEDLNVDLMTLNGSKIYGPKGIGVLYKKAGIQIEPLIFGGQHEQGLRAGTLNVPNIIGFAEALKLAQAEKAQETKRLTKLRDKLINGLLSQIKSAKLNGHTTKRLPNNVNIVIPNINSQELMLHLDEASIFVSTGSACASGAEKASKTLLAIGLSGNHVHSSIRMTLGKKTTDSNIDYVIHTLPKIVDKLEQKSGFKIVR